MTTTLQKWGNSQGIRVPKVLLNAMGIEDGAEVELNKQDTSPIRSANFPNAIILAFTMSTLALEIDYTLRLLDEPTAARLERLFRDAIDLVRPSATLPHRHGEREDWLQRLDQLRASVGTGRQGTSTEDILEDLRSDRC